MAILKAAFDNIQDKETEKTSATTDIPFKLSGSEEDKAQLAEIVNRTAKSELGKETLEIAAKAGYALEFKRIPGIAGLCNPDKKIIYMNPETQRSGLVSILAHEARHAGQFERGASIHDLKINNVKSQIMVDRAMEADAQRTACVTAFELKQSGDEGVYKTFTMKNRLIVKAFETALEKGENTDTAAFKAWYDNDTMKTAYENSYTQRLGRTTTLRTENEVKFEKNITGKEIADKLCTTKEGKSYFTDDPKILEESTFVDVSMYTMNRLNVYMNARKENYGLEPDKTFNELPLRLDTSETNKAKPISKQEEAAAKRIAAIKAKILKKKEENRKASSVKNQILANAMQGR